MSKSLYALLAAGAMVPVIATNGQVLDKIGNVAPNFNLAAIQQKLSEIDLQAMIQNPEQLLALLQSLTSEAAPYVEQAGGYALEQASTYYSDPVFFSNYSSDELSNLYEQAYPGYTSIHNENYQPSSGSSFSVGQFQLPGLGSAGNLGNLGGGLGGLGGGTPALFAPYYGYTSQKEFNDIVFD